MLQYFDVLCIGDAKIDIFFSLSNKNPYLHLDKKTNILYLAYGQKIPVENSSIMLGGNAANVAVGLSRLQIETVLMAELGKDEFSQKIINGLKSEKVNSDFLLQNPNSPSSFSVILSFGKERTILGQHVPREHNFSFNRISAKWIYLTSLGNKWENAYLKAMQFVKETHGKLAFNPGSLQLEKGYEDIKNILETTNILFVNKEEAIEISNIKSQISNTELLVALKKLGPKIVVITDGKNGSFAVSENGEFLSQNAVKTTVVEKTGTGDAYASGFLAAFVSNFSLQTAMAWGSLNASGTMSTIGAQNGLLSRREMERANDQ